MEKKYEESIIEALEMPYLSETQKENAQRIIRNELEIRVGEQMSNELTDVQLSEFEDIIDAKASENKLWLEFYFPDYRQSAAYKNLLRRGLEGDELINEVASNIWLIHNKPDFARIIDDCKAEIQSEILDHKHLILGTE